MAIIVICHLLNLIKVLICFDIGVDDNGSGVVAMLDVARQLTEMNRRGVKRNNTIIFMSFDIEEQGKFNILRGLDAIGRFSALFIYKWDNM